VAKPTPCHGLPTTKRHKSRECPAIIANMAKKVSATAKFTRFFQPKQNNLDLAKINAAISTNKTNVVLLII